MRKYFFLACTLVLSQFSISQEITTEVLKNFNSSIIIKVYEINKYAKLSPQRQVDLAQLLFKKDSMITNMILQKMSKAEIESAAKNMDSQIFSVDGMTAYLDSVAFRTAGNLAKREMEFIHSIDVDHSILAGKLLDVLTKKNSLLFSSISGGYLKNKNILKQEDSVLNTSLANLFIQKHEIVYFTNYINQVEKIKKLPDTLKRKISDRYLLLCKSNELTPLENVENAMHIYVTDTAIYAQLYKKTILSQSRFSARSELRQYLKYRPSKDCYDELGNILSQKHYQFALINQTYASYPGTRDSLQLKIAAKNDSLIDATLLKDGVFINSSQFAVAIKMGKILKLTSLQIDSLVEKGMYLSRIKDSIWRVNPLYPYDSKDYENYQLSKILNESQHASLLMLRYKTDAQTNAENDWKDLEKRGLTKDMERAKIVDELVSYYIRLKSSSSLFAYDLNKQAANARHIKENMPESLRLLQNARKHNVNLNKN